MNNVKLFCPSCSKTGFIQVDKEAIKSLARGLLAVNIPSTMICPHAFVAYIDSNLEVRDYFTPDFQVEIPDIEPYEAIQDVKLPGKDIVDVDLIKLNVSGMLLTYIIKSIFSKQKIIILSEHEFLYRHIIEFFKYITKDAFEIDISLISEEIYKKNKKQYKDSMVFKRNEIIQNYKKKINPKRLNVEKNIVNKFITERELGYSYIFLKNEILKAYKLSKSIVDFIEAEKVKSKKVNILEITANLETVYYVKINPVYLEFLIGIAESYFNVSVPSVSESFLKSL